MLTALNKIWVWLTGIFGGMKEKNMYHEIQGHWELVSREGQENPPKSVRHFTHRHFRWVDEGRPDAAQSGTYFLRADGKLVCVHGTESEVYEISIQGMTLNIRRVEPTTGQTTVYRRTRGALGFTS